MVHVGGLVTVEEEFDLFFVAVCLIFDAPADDEEEDFALCFEFEQEVVDDVNFNDDEG